MWSEFGDKKNLTRIPYKRSLRHRHTFCIKPDFSQINFFTASRRANPIGKVVRMQS
jgi:hypothetical protein